MRVRHTLRYIATYVYGKNGFAEVSNNLTKNKSENNIVWTIKIIIYLKLVARILKLFATLSSMLKHST